MTTDFPRNDQPWAPDAPTVAHPVAAFAPQPHPIAAGYAPMAGAVQYTPAPQFPPVGPLAPVAPQVSGATAKAVGVLALLGVVHMLVLIATALGSEPAGVPTGYQHLDTLQVVAGLVTLVFLGAGGILVFLRKQAGRYLVMAGCLLHLVAWIVRFVFIKKMVDDLVGDDLSPAFAGGMGIGFVLTLAFPIVTLGLALAPATTRWFAAATKA
ncbi:MAG: hypothetical protein QM774_08950 [Gordonia sp. (in: high G+C Gram-positive bacteria)]|uniref:hypothetical protein n=1 Tax=Gordonia sp. (in: high G+C Gram-positive bacteria) TaxID=84139 RepID=UPI0039E51FDF